uniref:Choline/carnitine acyltransferase domain-containing protein n=1 Tax=Anabas testudineus TaxID=64144 RepID=A0A3Q1HWN2_ANATE
QYGSLGKTSVKVDMVNPCGLMKLCHLVKPVSVTLVAGRNLSQLKTLPKPTVPPLKRTCELYLSSLETFLQPEELNHTKKLVEEFLIPGGVGETLQKGLERRACNTENWITDSLLKLECLKRKPLVVLLNFGILCTRKDIRDKQGQISDTLPVEYMKGKPLCMKQYEQVFSSCRIPGAKRDSLLFLAKSSNPPKHITVVHNGQFFLLDIYNSDGTLLTVDQLCVQLDRICNSSLQTSMDPVGILTTQRRDVWNKSYISLMQDETNKESLSAIESSILTLCLDGPMPPVSDERMHRKAAFFQMFHGGGSQWYSGNRWFDKGLQVIIGEDGHRGINCGHTVADGTVFLYHVFYFVYRNKETPHMIQTPSDPLPMPQKLHFNITPEIKQDIEEAKQHLDTVVQNVDVEITVFNHFGKNAIKARKMSPDAFVQMAIQLAYYRVYQQCCVTVEPASLRTFRLGRLALIHPTSNASVAFVKAFDDPNKQNLEKVDLLEKALKEHKKSTEMVMSGQAVAEHLMGLMCQASEENIPMPDVFTDTSFCKTLDFFHLSSNTGCLTCNTLDQPGTYDVGYSIMDSHIDCRVSSLEASNTCKEKDPARLSRALEDALLDMMTLLEETPRVDP